MLFNNTAKLACAINFSVQDARHDFFRDSFAIKFACDDLLCRRFAKM